jgi:Leucine-rich repeat (LRR) protein
LKRLTSLKKLSINTFGKNGIDISPLINLEYFAIQWRPNVKGFEHCDKLQELLLIDFKPEKDLSKISSVVSLKKLVIKVSSIASLAGIESLANLEEILLGNCRKITSLAPLNELKKLRKITLDGTGKHLDFETLGHLPNIKEFFVVSCKNPPSKQWVAERLPNVLDYRGDWK